MARVVVVVADGVGAFEVGIAAQLFGLDRSDEGLPTYDFDVCGSSRRAVVSAAGFEVRPTRGLAEVDAADLVVVPPIGHPADRVEPRMAGALRAAERAGARLFSICTGAFVLADAGLLDERRATTHWQFTGLLARRFPTVCVDEDALFVRDGSVLTSAGAAAGLDAGLSLLRDWHGGSVANAIARRLVLPAVRDGGQSQYVERPLPFDETPSTSMARLVDWVGAHLDQPLTVADLAARVHQSPRTFSRRFREATGTTPHRWLVDQRLGEAERLLESSAWSVEQVAARVGFGSVDTLRHHMATRRGSTPSGHRRRFARNPGE